MATLSKSLSKELEINSCEHSSIRCINCIYWDKEHKKLKSAIRFNKRLQNIVGYQDN